MNCAIPRTHARVAAWKEDIVVGVSMRDYHTPVSVPSGLVGDNWGNRVMGMLCVRCVYFVPKNDKLGRCRRHSPTINGFPPVFQTDWCGDHKLDEGKI
jgi:hypothetical protein